MTPKAKLNIWLQNQSETMTYKDALDKSALESILEADLKAGGTVPQDQLVQRVLGWLRNPELG
jgi:hypothetical protein